MIGLSASEINALFGESLPQICLKCDSACLRIRLANNGSHAELFCADCGCHVLWIGKRIETDEAEAGREDNTPGNDAARGGSKAPDVEPGALGTALPCSLSQAAKASGRLTDGSDCRPDARQGGAL